jgi:hypothetical protein
MRKLGERSSDSKSILEQLYVKAEKVYKESNGKITDNAPPQKRKRALPNKIEDKVFENWLKGINQESPTPVEHKPRQLKSAKSKDESDDDNDETETDKKPTPR